MRGLTDWKHETETGNGLSKCESMWKECKGCRRTGPVINTLVHTDQVAHNRYFISAIIGMVKFLAVNHIQRRWWQFCQYDSWKCKHWRYCLYLSILCQNMIWWYFNTYWSVAFKGPLSRRAHRSCKSPCSYAGKLQVHNSPNPTRHITRKRQTCCATVS